MASGLEAFEDSCELLSDDVSEVDVELSVPLVLVLSALELPDGEMGKDTKDSLEDAFPFISPDGTKFCCKKEACIIGNSGLLGMM